MNLLSFFLFDWISDYFNTPKYEMTTQIELLGVLAVGIIVAAFLGLVVIICKLVGWFK